MFILFSSAASFAQEKQFDKYGGWVGLKGERKGYFHAQDINGRWWIITPEGNVFWSVGIYCVRFGGLPETDTNKRAYQEACVKKYGSEGEWANATRMQLYKWGFNTIGDWSSDSIYHEPGFAYVVGIDLPRKTENVIPKGSYGYFPDVFSQEFNDAVVEIIAEKFKYQPYLIDDPWLLGYFLADEPSWYGSKQRRGALTDDFINLDSAKAGKKAWVDFIKIRYSSITELNTSWGTNFKNFEELLSVNKIINEANTEKDKIAFLKVIAEQFSRVLAETLRKYDKYHMILGSRPSCFYPEVVEGIGKYCDIFATSSYGLNQGYRIDPNFSNIIDEIYTYGKKPIMLGVLLTAQDSGLPHGILRTQKDRGISYWRYLARVASHPAIVGLHWFQYFDPPLKCYDERAANWGLVNDRDEPYTEAVNFIAQANKLVYAYALGLTDFAPEFDAWFVLKQEKTPQISDKPNKTIAIPIANAGFEESNKYWDLQAWKGKSKASIDYSQKHSGRASLKIVGGPDEGWGSVGVGVQGAPKLILKPGYQYRLSAWIKTRDVEQAAFVRIKTKYTNEDAGYFETEAAYGTSEWKQIEGKFSPRDENTAEYLDAQLVGRGTVWFDDISLEVLE